MQSICHFDFLRIIKTKNSILNSSPPIALHCTGGFTLSDRFLWHYFDQINLKTQTKHHADTTVHHQVSLIQADRQVYF